MFLGGTSLVVHCLRMHLPMHRAQVQFLVRELGSHMLQGLARKKKKEFLGVT